MLNKYKEGSIVVARTDPGQKLLIRRFVDHIYYCKIYDDQKAPELVFFERELTDDLTVR